MKNIDIIIIYPISECNCRCIMCDHWRSNHTGRLDRGDIAKMLPDWRALGVKRVAFSGGEPLLHPHLKEMCAIVQDAGIKVTILSNGLLLSHQAVALSKYCRDYVVSLDGPANIHNLVRNAPNAYEKLAKGISAVKRTNGDARIVARCTVQLLNHHFLRETVNAAHELQLDQISFLPVDVRAGAFSRPIDWSGGLHGLTLAAADISQLENELNFLMEEYQADFASRFIAESPTKLQLRILRYFRALHGNGDFAPVRCNAPEFSAVIESDGTVRPCFFLPPYGNVHAHGGLSNLLLSPEAASFRQQLRIAGNPYCRKCVCSMYLPEYS